MEKHKLIRECFLIVLAWLLVTLVGLAGQQICPQGCRCLPLTMRCINVNLKEIPNKDIPEDTVVLDLRHNNIKEITEESLINLPKLKTLATIALCSPLSFAYCHTVFLGNNRIQKINPFAFQSLQNLKHLYLFNNKLAKIEDNTFTGLRHLEQLYLQDNDITEIQPNSFKDLISLQRLYLQKNNLENLNTSLVKPMKALRTIKIGLNKINCTCEFVKMVKDMIVEGSVYVTSACSYKGEEKQPNVLKFTDIGCYKPKFTTELTNQVAAHDTTVRLPCKADGVPKPKKKWLKDSASIRPEVKHEILSDGTLVLHHFSEEAAGYYQCVVENAAGKSFSGATVSFVSHEVVPTFLETPTDGDAIVNSVGLLNCRATGFPRPNIIWIKNGQLIQTDEHYKIHFTGDLEIQNLNLQDSGYYTCRAENKMGSVIHTAKLTIKAPPSFTKLPENQEQLDGGSIEFPCQATGYPFPAIAWQKNGGRLPSDGRYVVLPSGTLRVLYLKDSDEGTYECQAINVIGVISATANLTVRSRVRPFITVKPQDTTVTSGNTISFRCVADGSPKPFITWIKNGLQVATGNRFTVNSNEDIIVINDIGKVDAGRWECVARNSYGSTSVAFKLTVHGLKDGDYKGDKFVIESIKQAKMEVDRAIQLTKQKLENFKPKSPADLLALFRFPSPDAVEIARSAEIFEVALELIQKSVDSGILHEGMKQKYHFNDLVSPEHIRLLANLSGCTAHQKLVNCSDLCFHQKYRTYDGSCNNFNHPMWGAALTPFSRLLIPNYENGFNLPYGWNKTTDLPSARKISLDLISSVNITSDEKYTHMLMQWGQFLDHDMDFTVTSPSTTRFNDGTSCQASCENQQPCFPIRIPEDDPRIKRYKCMEFTRSSAVCGSGSTSVFFDAITPRQQINQITSFIDASNVYGSSDNDAKELRDLENENGFLKRGIHTGNGNYLLPYNKDTKIDCQVNKSESSIPCFLTGDHRANEQLGLLSMHTLWMRQHNKLARELKRLNPHWNGERIYQEARKIVGGQMQHITFTEWLPKIFGEDGMKRLGEYKHYNPTTDPSIFNSFATAAFRFGHTLIQPFLARLNDRFEEVKEGNLPLHKAFFSPYRIVEEGGIDPLVRGLFAIPVKDRSVTNQPFNTELTERLFAMAHTVALDLAALNIQRGRDHGLPSYNSWRQFCNLSIGTDFDDFRNEIKNKILRQKLRTLYKDVNKIDLIVGGILEDPLPGTKLGPVFMCLISSQFKRLRDGDRFWYENPGVFSPSQLVQIKQTTLSRVICDNSDNIRHVQQDAFSRVTRISDYTPCFEHPQVDLRFWKECCNSKKACYSSDRSTVLSNHVKEDRSSFSNTVSRTRRSVNTNNSMTDEEHEISNEIINTDLSGKITTMKENVWKHKDIKTHKHKLNHRVERLEKRIEELSHLTNDMKDEISELREMLKSSQKLLKAQKSDKTNKRVHRNMRRKINQQCIDENLVREHEEQWFDLQNRRCSCLDSKILCS